MHDYDKLLRAALMTVHRYARGGYADRGFVEGEATYDPMGNVIVGGGSEDTSSPLYKAIEAASIGLGKAGAAVGEPLRKGAENYLGNVGKAFHESGEYARQGLENTVSDKGPLYNTSGPLQYALGSMGQAFSPLTGAAMSAGQAATQLTGNPDFGNRVEFVGGMMDPSHVGMLKGAAAIPMAARTAAKAGETVLGSGPVRTHNGVNWNFFEDARKLSKNDFLNKYAVEPNNPAQASHADLLKIAEKQKNLPAHYEYNPKALDPFEMESWEEALSPKSAKQVQEVQSVIQKHEPLPPILVEGSPYDTKYRPMVLDGHHRTIAALNENASSIPVFFTNKTLNEIWSHLNKVNEKSHGGTIPFGPEAAQRAVQIAKQQAGRR